jgi:phosphatidylserine/phosphatidylglycerophosphate/cardiolipin synthase-like enzyme
MLGLSSFAQASVKAFFNHRHDTQYADPYRGFSRTGDNLEAEIMAAMKSAQTRIWVAVQEFRLPEIALLLVQKKQQGIDVRIVIEHDYNHEIGAARPIRNSSTDPESYSVQRQKDLLAFVDQDKDGKISLSEKASRDAVYILRQGGIQVVDDTSDGSEGSGLMHHKFVVIDQDVTLLSTANFTLSCIHGDYLNMRSRGNANTLVVMTHQGLNQAFSQEFSELWGDGKRGHFGLGKKVRPLEVVTDGQTKVSIQFSPTSLARPWSESSNGIIAHHLAKAETSVQMGLFVFSDQKLADSLKTNTFSPRVEALIEARFAYRYYSELLDLMGEKYPDENCRFEKGNNPWTKPAELTGQVRLDSGDMLHHKFAVLDGRKVIFGSHNWSDSANTKNDEFLVVIEDQSLAQEFTSEFERLKNYADFALPRSMTKYPPNCQLIQ